MAAEELIERILPGDVHGEAVAATPRSPPHLLEAGHGPREGHADRRVELAYVDAELERVGGDHAQQLTVGEPPLDLLALRGRVAGSVGSNALAELWIEPVERVAQDQLHSLAGLHEADHASARAYQLREHLGRLVQCRAAQP